MVNIRGMLDKITPLVIKAFELKISEFSDMGMVVAKALDVVRNTDYLDRNKGKELETLLHGFKNIRNRFVHREDLRVDHEENALSTIRTGIKDLVAYNLLDQAECDPIINDIDRQLKKYNPSSNPKVDEAECDPFSNDNNGQLKKNNPANSPVVDKAENPEAAQGEAMESMASAMDALLDIGEVVHKLRIAFEEREKFQCEALGGSGIGESSLPDFTKLIQKSPNSGPEGLSLDYWQIAGQSEELSFFVKKLGMFYNTVLNSNLSESLFTTLDVSLGMKQEALKMALYGIRRDMIGAGGIRPEDCVLDPDSIFAIVKQCKFDICAIKSRFELGVIPDLARQEVYFPLIKKAIKNHESSLWGGDNVDIDQVLKDSKDTTGFVSLKIVKKDSPD